MSDPRVRSLDDIVGQMRREFQEMPGLRLTDAQARRLWTLDAAACRAALDSLIASGFLIRTPEGSVVRVDLGRLAKVGRDRRLTRRVPAA